MPVQHASVSTAIPPAQKLQKVYVPVMLEYSENAPVTVRGPVTGREYKFSGARRTQSVESDDVPGLIQTGFFRRRS
jgi:hypothetical protein